MRAFIGFLMQDEAGLAVTVSGMTPNLIKRFIAWRSGAHSYAVPWKGKHYNHTSKGIKGESIQRNIEDIRAALNHAANNGRIPYVPKIPRSEEHTSELQSLMRISYAVFCLKKQKKKTRQTNDELTYNMTNHQKKKHIIQTTHP